MPKLLEQTVMVNPEELVILPELEFYNLSRTDAELLNLEEQIKLEGKVRDPIVVWPRPEGLVLVDGFSRRRIVQKNGLDIILEAHQMEFEDIEEAKYWIRINQDSRRNLTDDQQAYYIGILYNDLKNNNGALISYLKAKGKLDILESFSESEGDIVHTAKLLGQIYGINEKTIRRNSQFADGIEKIRSSNNAMAEMILHNNLEVGGTRLKVNRGLVEKFGTLRTSKKIETFEDIQKTVEKAKRKAAGELEEDYKVIVDAVKGYLKNPLLSEKDRIFDLLEKHLGKYGKEVSGAAA